MREELKDFGLVMEGERLPLINANNRRNWCWKLNSRYSQSCVTSGLVIVCLVWMGIMTSLILLPLGVLLHIKYRSVLLASFSVTYCLFPVFGYLGERWTRYYIIMTGTFVASSGCILLEIVRLLENLIDETNGIITFVLVFVGTVACSCGLGLFGANIIQFSAAQLPDASSQQLASIARWWTFALCFALFIRNRLTSFLLLHVRHYQISRYIMLCILFLFSIAGIMIGVCFRRKFTIEPPRSVDPVKLIYQVIKYAWKHKHPERPSSFTYTDDHTPSRLDFGKERYGGPFTTDQVENVKSFGRILAVLLSSILFCQYSLIDEDYATQNVFYMNGTLSDSLLNSVNTNTVLVVMIPLLQLIVMPCFPWLVPSILNRMWFGLFLTVLCFVVATICLNLVSIAGFNYLVIVFNIISSVGSAFIVFSSLEFIFAQAPCDMQGLLLGIWSVQFNSFLYLFENKVLIFYCVTTGLLILSLVAYSVAVYYYKYRVRNELSDINVQARIEEVYERDFRREDQETDNDTSFFLSSVQTLHTCN